MLKDIPTGSTFVIRLVEPLKSGFQTIGPRSGGGGKQGKKAYGSGKETLRFKANGNVAVEDEVILHQLVYQFGQLVTIGIFMILFQHDESTQAGIDAINALLDSFMGINDNDLATQVINQDSYQRTMLNDNLRFFILLFQIWELGVNKTNSMDFAEAIDNSDLEAFGFTDDFIIELWGAITDARQGRFKR